MVGDALCKPSSPPGPDHPASRHRATTGIQGFATVIEFIASSTSGFFEGSASLGTSSSRGARSTWSSLSLPWPLPLAYATPLEEGPPREPRLTEDSWDVMVSFKVSALVPSCGLEISLGFGVLLICVWSFERWRQEGQLTRDAKWIGIRKLVIFWGLVGGMWLECDYAIGLSGGN